MKILLFRLLLVVLLTGVVTTTYVLSAGTALPLPVRNERGEGWGEGHLTADTRAQQAARRPSSPRPSPLSEGGEGEKPGALNSYTTAPAQTIAFVAARVTAPTAGAPASAGLELAKTLSLITGVAISPLLGVGAVGAWEYFSTPKEKRNHLDWYAEPGFWIPALLLVAMVALKDILGTAAPSALKKPFDVAELIENKISGLVAAGAFVPLIIKIFGQHSAAGALLDPGLGAAGFAAIDVASVLNALITPFAIIAFLLVWLASHAITILIVISPFSSVDAALKLFRMALLSLVTITHFLNPYVGALFAVGIIIVSYFLAGWSFRLLVLGWVYAWDFVTHRRTRFMPQANANWMFTAAEIGGAPVRTYGRLVRTEDGQLTFEYGPWILLKKRGVALPSGNYSVGRGLFYPEIMLLQGDNARTMLTLPPRYRTHEEEVVRAYGFAGARDVGLLKGSKAAWAWLKSLVFPRDNGSVVRIVALLCWTTLSSSG